MHYANGKEAKAGDLVLNKQDNGTELIGILTGAQAQSPSCNGQLAVVARRVKSDAGVSPWIPVAAAGDWYVTLSQCNPIDSEQLFAPPVPAQS